MAENVRLFINSESRLRYIELTWANGAFAEIALTRAGPYHYFFVCTDDTHTKIDTPLNACDGDGYVQVAPTLTVGADDTTLPLDCIQSQTYLTKLLGPLSEWRQRLAVAHYCGYNMIHLTPIQLLGQSNSSYSIADQLTCNVSLKDTGSSTTPTYADIGTLTSSLRVDWNMLTCGDIVLNHTAVNSAFVRVHPECTYNIHNTPHLRPAYVLDRALVYFARDVERGVYVESHGLPTMITDEAYLETLHHLLSTVVIPPLNLHEYFTCDIDSIVDKFEQFLKDYTGAEHLHDSHTNIGTIQLQHPTYARNSATVDFVAAAEALNVTHRIDEPGRRRELASNLRTHLTALNGAACAHVADWMSQACSALIGHVRYERVAGDGPRACEYSERYPLFPQYFTYFDGVGTSLSEDVAAMDSQARAEHSMAFNGWVMGDDPLSNFAEEGRTELVASVSMESLN